MLLQAMDVNSGATATTLLEPLTIELRYTGSCFWMSLLMCTTPLSVELIEADIQGAVLLMCTVPLSVELIEADTVRNGSHILPYFTLIVVWY